MEEVKGKAERLECLGMLIIENPSPGCLDKLSESLREKFKGNLLVVPVVGRNTGRSTTEEPFRWIPFGEAQDE